MKNDLPPTYDFQISLMINCESTWPSLKMRFQESKILKSSNIRFQIPEFSCKHFKVSLWTHNSGADPGRVLTYTVVEEVPFRGLLQWRMQEP